MARLEWTSWPLRMRVRVSPSFPHRGSRVAGWWVVDRSRVYEPTVASLYAFVRVVATPPTSASPTGVTAYLAVHRCVALVCFLFPLRFAKKTSNIQKCVLSTRVVQWVSFRFVSWDRFCSVVVVVGHVVVDIGSESREKSIAARIDRRPSFRREKANRWERERERERDRGRLEKKRKGWSRDTSDVTFTVIADREEAMVSRQRRESVDKSDRVLKQSSW